MINAFGNLTITNSTRNTVINIERQIIFCQNPVGARLIFSMLLLGTELIFANVPPGAGLFWSLENVATPHKL